MTDNQKERLTAWGDESFRASTSGLAYSMIGLVLDDWSESQVANLRQILPKGASKLHWYEIVPDVKEKSLAAICALDFKATLVQTEPVDSAKQERARHKCLTRILPLLESQGVELFVLESRGKALDKRDVKLLDGLKGSRIVSTIRLEHVRGSDEPRLWVARSSPRCIRRCARQSRR